ncbi:MAG: cyclic nucleotide-binding domain-containing protein [Alphaproteobacteria bacterium]|nr:cyclic nucleotide-binding domain-containing protein [Alphaproteobacteria bacterium]
MSLNEEVELLRKITLFGKIEPAKLKLLAFASERIVYDGGQALCVQGETGDAAYIIMEGAADVIVETPKGPLTVASLGKNDIVGEIAILCDVPRTATVQAKERLIALKISKDLFYRMVNEFPQMAVEIMRELAMRLDRANRRLREAVAKASG